MVRAGADDASGLAAIFVANRDRLLRFFISRTRDRAEAEEIVQEIYLRLDRASGPLRDPVNYLHRVGLNLVVDRARERERRTRREKDWTESTTSRIGEDYVDERPSAFAQLAARKRAEQIGRALATLPPGAARVFRMHRIEGLSHAEVAQQLGISRKGVEKHMATALRHLAREIDP
ncbi:RNA polymerase sigma factor [Sphingobium sp. BYY-5]|uniref:RNA polymerase sigma factor n=1 Tax=Sphingobium sp. BYY-5 TaxID=2926400 RepID=UPI001FA7F9A6|nr:RNA polymerase sigma factor [Sphingobium sp. BYY-5]MCI4588936.1 RNA polymerase sigma factor [Sphingobium sp. BYY-5]